MLRLDLDDVTLVLNDWGGGQFLASEGKAGRVARLVLVDCEAFDNFPPGSVKPIALVARLPGSIWLFMHLLRIRSVRHSQHSYGGLSLRASRTR